MTLLAPDRPGTLHRAALARRLILVTGAPRSGTTVVGTQLGLADGAAALYEPMNGDSGDRVVTRYFERPGAAGFDVERFDDLVTRIAALELSLRSGVFRHERGLRKLAKRVVGGQSRRSLLRARLTPGLKTVIWKDPLAAMAARAAAERFDIPLVVTLRPPEAVVASFKRLNWYFDVHQIARSLDLDTPDGGALVTRQERDLVDAGAALWAMIYGDLADVARSRPGSVTFVTMDDVIADPRAVYARLFERLGLKAGARAEKALAALEARRDARGKSDTPSGHPHSRNRNLRAANTYWRGLLSDDEVALVRARTDRVRSELAELGVAL